MPERAYRFKHDHPQQRFLIVSPYHQRLSEEQNHRCAYCFREMCFERWLPNVVTLDHVRPACHGGSSYWLNAVAACYRCNNLRGHRDPVEFATEIQRRLAIGETLPEVWPKEMMARARRALRWLNNRWEDREALGWTMKEVQTTLALINREFRA